MPMSESSATYSETTSPPVKVQTSDCSPSPVNTKSHPFWLEKSDNCMVFPHERMVQTIGSNAASKLQCSPV